MRAILPSFVIVLCLAAIGTAAPNLGDKPKWEYAELTYRTIPGRPALIDGDGNEIPATAASMTLRLTTGEGELDAKSWHELAEKLKAKGIKKDSAVTLQKIQVLNFLGGEGWEVMDQQGSSVQSIAGFGNAPGVAGGGLGGGGFGGRVASTGTTTMLLKRRTQ